MLDRDDNLDRAIDKAVLYGGQTWELLEQADIVIETLAKHGYKIVKNNPTDAE